MAVTPNVLNPGALLTNAAAVYYAAPVNSRAIIKRAVFTNNDTAVRTITVYRVPTGDVPSNANKVIAAFPIAIGQDYSPVSLTNLVLNVGDSIQAFADVGGVVGIQLAGFVVT